MTKIKQVILTETYHDIFTNLVAAFYRCKTRSRLKFKKIILFFIHTHEYEKMDKCSYLMLRLSTILIVHKCIQA
jgi:hypothetical protein